MSFTAEAYSGYQEHILDTRDRRNLRNSFYYDGPFLSRNDHSDFHMYPRTASDNANIFPAGINVVPPTHPPVPTSTLPPVSVIPAGSEDIESACSICLKYFKEGDSVQPLNCGQKLHTECMNLLIAHNIANLRAFRCPCCRSCWFVLVAPSFTRAYGFLTTHSC